MLELLKNMPGRRPFPTIHSRIALEHGAQQQCRSMRSSRRSVPSGSSGKSRSSVLEYFIVCQLLIREYAKLLLSSVWTKNVLSFIVLLCSSSNFVFFKLVYREILER